MDYGRVHRARTHGAWRILSRLLSYTRAGVPILTIRDIEALVGLSRRIVSVPVANDPLTSHTGY